MIKKLQQAMKDKNIDMYVVVSGDEHLNEYLPVQNLRLKAVTTFENSIGFSGSAGTAVICINSRSHLFVDSRYHIQAEKTCAGEFEIHKLGKKGVYEPYKWIASFSKKNLVVGADPFVMSLKEWRLYENHIQKKGHTFLPISPNLVDTVWENRPEPPKKRIYQLPLKYTGKKSIKKLQEIQKQLRDANIYDRSKQFVLLLTKLDEIAWLTNLRGSDIDYNTVFESYALIFKNNAICFCHKSEENLEKYCPGWQFKPYEEYKPFLEKLAKDKSLKVWVDPSSINMGIRLIFSEDQILEKKCPIVVLKAIKNKSEIKSAKNAHKQAGVSVVKSFRYLEKVYQSGGLFTEKEFADLLYKEYSKLENFSNLSFSTIAGAGANGAIVHYSDLENIEKIPLGEMLLVDSGIQCAGGTTDATRTIILGEPNEKQKRIYTLVLQAHIRLARQIFPEGTKGASLDAITRSGLWNYGLDYGHGTGHGVGAFLNVHEGPQSISPFSNEISIQEGMVVSIEPGYYEENWGGIRLENLYVVKKTDRLKDHPDGKRWLCFETLTLIPFDRRLIDMKMLSSEENQWLVDYNFLVNKKISSMLKNSEDLKWLNWACRFE